MVNDRREFSKKEILKILRIHQVEPMPPLLRLRQQKPC